MPRQLDTQDLNLGQAQWTPEQGEQARAQIRQQIQSANLNTTKLAEIGEWAQRVIQDPSQFPAFQAWLREQGLPESEIPQEPDYQFLMGIAAMAASAGDEQPTEPAPQRTPVAKAMGPVSPQQLQSLAAQGRSGDTMLAHINPQEAAMLESMGGMGTINPATGLPEYGWFSDLWKGIKSVVKSVAPFILPVVALAFPALIPAVGAALGASGAAASIVGAAVISGGATALSGGSISEVLTSAALSGLGNYLTPVLGDYVGKAVGVTDAGIKSIIGSATLSGGLAAARGGSVGQILTSAATGAASNYLGQIASKALPLITNASAQQKPFDDSIFAAADARQLADQGLDANQIASVLESTGLPPDVLSMAADLAASGRSAEEISAAITNTYGSGATLYQDGGTGAQNSLTGGANQRTLEQLQRTEDSTFLAQQAKNAADAALSAPGATPENVRLAVLQDLMSSGVDVTAAAAVTDAILAGQSVTSAAYRLLQQVPRIEDAIQTTRSSDLTPDTPEYYRARGQEIKNERVMQFIEQGMTADSAISMAAAGAIRTGNNEFQVGMDYYDSDGRYLRTFGYDENNNGVFYQRSDSPPDLPVNRWRPDTTLTPVDEYRDPESIRAYEEYLKTLQPVAPPPPASGPVDGPVAPPPQSQPVIENPPPGASAIPPDAVRSYVPNTQSHGWMVSHGDGTYTYYTDDGRVAGVYAGGEYQPTPGIGPEPAPQPAPQPAPLPTDQRLPVVDVIAEPEPILPDFTPQPLPGGNVTEADFIAADAAQLAAQTNNNTSAVQQNLTAAGVDPVTAATAAGMATSGATVPEITQAIVNQPGFVSPQPAPVPPPPAPVAPQSPYDLSTGIPPSQTGLDPSNLPMSEGYELVGQAPTPPGLQPGDLGGGITPPVYAPAPSMGGGTGLVVPGVTPEAPPPLMPQPAPPPAISPGEVGAIIANPLDPSVLEPPPLPTRNYGSFTPAPPDPRWSGSLAQGGVNPGVVAGAVRPAYPSLNTAQAQYYWGSQPYFQTPADLARYNATAPAQPWGQSQGWWNTPTDYSQIQPIDPRLIPPPQTQPAPQPAPQPQPMPGPVPEPPPLLPIGRAPQPIVPPGLEPDSVPQPQPMPGPINYNEIPREWRNARYGYVDPATGQFVVEQELLPMPGIPMPPFDYPNPTLPIDWNPSGGLGEARMSYGLAPYYITDPGYTGPQPQQPAPYISGQGTGILDSIAYPLAYPAA